MSASEEWRWIQDALRRNRQSVAQGNVAAGADIDSLRRAVSQGSAPGSDYGQGLNNSAKQPGIWIDRDGDGVNDRYQRGPGERNEGPAAGRKTSPGKATPGTRRPNKPGGMYGG